jgi:hypothetical protein
MGEWELLWKRLKVYLVGGVDKLAGMLDTVMHDAATQSKSSPASLTTLHIFTAGTLVRI